MTGGTGTRAPASETVVSGRSGQRRFLSGKLRRFSASAGREGSCHGSWSTSPPSRRRYGWKRVLMQGGSAVYDGHDEFLPPSSVFNDLFSLDGERKRGRLVPDAKIRGACRKNGVRPRRRVVRFVRFPHPPCRVCEFLARRAVGYGPEADRGSRVGSGQHRLAGEGHGACRRRPWGKGCGGHRIRNRPLPRHPESRPPAVQKPGTASGHHFKFDRNLEQACRRRPPVLDRDRKRYDYLAAPFGRNPPPRHPRHQVGEAPGPGGRRQNKKHHGQKKRHSPLSHENTPFRFSALLFLRRTISRNIV